VRKTTKRLFDIVCSFIGLIILSPVFAAAAAVIRLDSRGPVLFRQERIGRNFVPFTIYKFRTMSAATQGQGALITVGGDKRITRAGVFLRKYKIDELPQLINVLKGDMSLVGPRPEVRKYVDLFVEDYAKLLRIRPGITDPASIRYSEEETVLAAAGDWEEDYINRILPQKIALSLRYAEKPGVLMDVRLVLRTVLKLAETR
jgi:lipopolysaccharide/colanic/teichoic acid biosynthesis glycosyltransferase